MIYAFDIIDVVPILSFFSYEQQTQQNPSQSKAYLGSYQCTLDAFIQATNLVPKQPEWDWDRAVESIVNFWLKNEANIRYWKEQLDTADRESLIVGRIVDFDRLRTELEFLV
jgi:hypothetical protein